MCQTRLLLRYLILVLHIQYHWYIDVFKAAVLMSLTNVLSLKGITIMCYTQYLEFAAYL